MREKQEMYCVFSNLYGNSVAYTDSLDDNVSLKVSPKTENPQITSFRILSPKVFSGATKECVSWGDQIEIKLNNDIDEVGCDNVYGCRIAQAGDNGGLKFSRKTDDNSVTNLFVYPPNGVEKSGCVHAGDQLQLKKRVQWNTGLKLQHDQLFGSTNSTLESVERVVKMSALDSDSSNYFLQLSIGREKINPECVSWHEPVVISLESYIEQQSSDNPYGDKVAHMSVDGNQFFFDHGGAEPMSFIIRPPYNETRSGCLMQDDKFVLAMTTSLSTTATCGWGGCRVAHVEETTKTIKFDHGKSFYHLFSLSQTSFGEANLETISFQTFT